MTKKIICTVHDQISEIWSPVFQAENEEHAKRIFTDSIPANHAHDFVLWQIGAFDDDTGELHGFDENPKLLEHGKNLPPIATLEPVKGVSQ